MLVVGPEAEIVEEAGLKVSPYVEVSDSLKLSILGTKPVIIYNSTIFIMSSAVSFL